MMMCSTSPLEAVVEHLIFLCPATGHAVASGVESEIGTLLRIRQQKVRALCSACGAWHEWPVRDAFLARAARPRCGIDHHIA
jgi:transcription elongation factor Elf1